MLCLSENGGEEIRERGGDICEGVRVWRWDVWDGDEGIDKCFVPSSFPVSVES